MINWKKLFGWLSFFKKQEDKSFTVWGQKTVWPIDPEKIDFAFKDCRVKNTDPNAHGAISWGVNKTEEPDKDNQILDKYLDPEIIERFEKRSREDRDRRDKLPKLDFSEAFVAAQKATPEQVPNLVPDPSNYLDESYPDDLKWDHPDDLFVEFQVMGTIVVDDVAFFMNYVLGTLSQDEKEKYPCSFFPCFAEISEVVITDMRQPMNNITEDQACFVVVFQNTMGLILIGSQDTVDIRRRSFGFEVEEESNQLHYQLQFMRFSQEAIKRLDFAGSPRDHYASLKRQYPPLRVNFAIYNEAE